MQNFRYIIVTSVYNRNRTSVILNVNGINAIREGDDGYTNIKHIGHNNGGYDVIESVEEVLELIKQSQYI